jgi:GNAT superfamily N-acetyltransferase
MNTTVQYVASLNGITAAMLEGFFEGWPDPPTPENHLRLLRGSAHVVLAMDDGCVVGFVNAISNGVMSAYIPLLEVLPAYKGQGIGCELVQRILARLDHLYMVDVMCDADILPFYEKLGMTLGNGAMLRNYERQSCEVL